jgi:hypothetical protein
MIPKYTIEYSVRVGKHTPVVHYSTDDPVAAEEFLVELLGRGLKIRAIKHEGMDLPGVDFDRMIKTAAQMLAARLICAALDIKAEEERYRFGLAA